MNPFLETPDERSKRERQEREDIARSEQGRLLWDTGLREVSKQVLGANLGGTTVKVIAYLPAIHQQPLNPPRSEPFAADLFEALPAGAYDQTGLKITIGRTTYLLDDTHARQTKIVKPGIFAGGSIRREFATAVAARARTMALTTPLRYVMFRQLDYGDRKEWNVCMCDTGEWWSSQFLPNSADDMRTLRGLVQEKIREDEG